MHLFGSELVKKSFRIKIAWIENGIFDRFLHPTSNAIFQGPNRAHELTMMQMWIQLAQIQASSGNFRMLGAGPIPPCGISGSPVLMHDANNLPATPITSSGNGFGTDLTNLNLAIPDI